MAFEPANRKAPNKVNRLADRGKYDEDTVYAVSSGIRRCLYGILMYSADYRPLCCLSCDIPLASR